MTSISDGTRTVYYGYSTAYNPQGDLTSFTDPEGKISTYIYDTNHEITATLDAHNQLVVSNLYDSPGTCRDPIHRRATPTRRGEFYWSGWQTVAQDPAGGQQTFFYDDQVAFDRPAG